MRLIGIAPTRPLFAWDALDDSPTLGTFRTFLASIPDEALLDSLRRTRGKGRNDYPIHVLWGTLLLAIVLRHQTLDACLEELKRHPASRLLIDIEREEKVPKPHNMSRFLETLGEEDQLVKLHLLVDVKHEVVIAYRITNTKAGDNELIGDLVAQGKQNLPGDRIKTLAYDIDDGQVYGSRRFHAHVGAVLIVHLGLATVLARAERYEGFFGKMRLSPIAAELRKLLEKPPAAEEKAAR